MASPREPPEPADAEDPADREEEQEEVRAGSPTTVMVTRWPGLGSDGTARSSSLRVVTAVMWQMIIEYTGQSQRTQTPVESLRTK